MGVGKLGFFLSVTMISAIVTSLIVNIHLVGIINQLNTVNSQLNEEISDLQMQIQDLQQTLDAYIQHIEGLSNLSAWVNKSIVIEGKLCGPSIYIPESVPPWNYELFGPNETIETIGKLGTVAMGVLWNGEDEYAFEKVIVIGVVREGHWLYLYGEQPVCYYIEAQEIIRL